MGGDSTGTQAPAERSGRLLRRGRQDVLLGGEGGVKKGRLERWSS